MDFIEFPDGSLINPTSIVRVKTFGAASRVEYVTGSVETLSDAQLEAIRKVIKPKEKKKQAK